MEIERLYVFKKFHDKKIGAALMQSCIDVALKQKCEIIWLGVWEHNAKAISFYEKWGFTKFGSHDFILGDDIQKDFLMMKDLK